MRSYKDFTTIAQCSFVALCVVLAGGACSDDGTTDSTEGTTSEDVPYPLDDLAVDDVSLDAEGAPDSRVPVPVECGDPPCTLWEATCEDDFGYRMCTLDENGCVSFGPPVFCSPGGSCVSGACLGTCTTPRMVVLADGSQNLAQRWSWMEPGLDMGLREAWSGAEFAWSLMPGRTDDELCLAEQESDFSGDPDLGDLVAGVTPSALNAGGLPIHDGLRRARELLQGGTDGAAVVLILARAEACSSMEQIRSEVIGLKSQGVRLSVFWVGLPGDRAFADAIAEPVGAAVRLPTNEFALASAFRETFEDAGICCLDEDGDGYGGFCSNGPDCNEDDIEVHAPLCGDSECGDDGCGGSCGECDEVSFGTSTCESGVCSLVCDPGFHGCDGICVDSSDVLHCAGSCSPCPTPAGGTAGCGEVGCEALCADGFHACDGICVSSDSTNHCGTSCEPCPVVNNSVATCDAGACGISCDEAFLLCGGACSACPVNGVLSTECSAENECIANECMPGFVVCESGCCDFHLVVAADAPAPATAGSWPVVSVSYDGQAHIAFYRSIGGAGEIVHGMGGPGGFAESVIASQGYSSFGRYPRIDIDLLGTVRIGYRGGLTSGMGEITVASLTDGVWSEQVLADTYGVYGYAGADFDLTSDGLAPAVAYPGTSQVAVSKVDGFTIDDWSVLGSPGETYTNTPAVEFDQSGIAHVVLIESGDKVKYAVGGETTWAVQEIANIGAVGSHRPDISISGSDVSICFLDNSVPTSVGVFVARQSQNFAPVLVDADANQACALAISDDGVLHVVYRSAGGDLRHGWIAGSGVSTRVLLPAPSPGIGYRWPSVDWHDNAIHVTAWNQYDQSVVYLLDPLQNLGN